ncbi:hypothetical protein [Nostoc sp. LPT]|uniref:hypothetical protein n=1 Tax=Nostoc sp. LPT TaxID=2815387 RepID=UPI001DC3A38B|nr:hypothetical protein [Nostoc sp. LPT]MBN4006979.1 hypothetical protein [Nostoc sp. LPT]
MDSQSQLQPPPETFLAPLLSLRDYYAPIVEKYEKLYIQALANLNHVEALLSVWSDNGQKPTLEVINQPVASSLENLPLEDNDFTPEPKVNLVKPVSSQLPLTENSSSAKQYIKAPIVISESALLALENLSLINSDAYDDLRLRTPEVSVNLVEPINSEIAPTNDLELETPFPEFQNIEMPLIVNEVVTDIPEDNSLPVNSDNITESEVKLVEPSQAEALQTNNLEINESSSTSGEADEPPAPTSKEIETQQETLEKSLLWSEIPMLPEYQSLNRTEAILKVLQKHKGTVCHIDFVVRSLYGDLEPDIFKLVKGRVQSTLTYGRESGKWSLVPGKPGSFTLDLKLLNSNRTSPFKKSKNRKPDPQAQTNSVPMQGEFSGQFLIDALTSLLSQNPGKVFNVTEIIEELYGELDPSDVIEVKPKVLNELSRGHRTGRFSRVPEEIGLYTWDSKLLQQVSAS